MTVEVESVTAAALATLVLGQNLAAGNYRLYFQARTDTLVTGHLVTVQVYQGSTLLSFQGNAGDRGKDGYLWDPLYWTPSATYPVTMDLWPYVNFAITTNEVISVKLTALGGGSGKNFWVKTVRLVKV